MGSRIRIKLTDLHGTPGIGVILETAYIGELKTETDTQATVTFAEVGACGEFICTFDTTSYEGRIELSCDFNWFRYPNDPLGWNQRLLRALYEYGVNFQVSH